MEKQMSVIEKLASALGRRDEVPNRELAEEIVSKNDSQAVKELVVNLKHKKKDVQNDCIKVLYEVGERKPTMIVEYRDEFLDLLESKNNRLQWGGMMALDAIASVDADTVYDVLPKILNAADKGSVITKDHAVGILIKLCENKRYNEDLFSLLNEQLLKSPPNQFPMYAERTLPIIDNKNREVFIKTVNSRLDDMEKESKRKRLDKVLKKASGS